LLPDDCVKYVQGIKKDNRYIDRLNNFLNKIKIPTPRPNYCPNI